MRGERGGGQGQGGGGRGEVGCGRGKGWGGMIQGGRGGTSMMRYSLVASSVHAPNVRITYGCCASLF